MSDAFAKTTFGPPAPTGLDTNKHSLIADIKSGVIEMVDDAGVCHGIQTALLVLQAQTALATITTAQNLFSQALAAGALNKKGRTLQISGTLIFSTASANTPTIAIALKLGSVTLCTLTSAAVAASITNGQLQFQFTISIATTGAAGTIESHGDLFAQLSAALGTALASYADPNVAVSSAVDLTAAQSLVATITGAGGTILAAQLRQLVIEVVN